LYLAYNPATEASVWQIYIETLAHAVRMICPSHSATETSLPGDL
jgi:hypothetical protein